MELQNLNEYEAAARETLPAAVYDYFAGGAEDELALRENREAFARVKLAYRVLRGVGEADPMTDLLGERLALPVLVAPTAFQAMAHPEGEIAAARAAARAGTIYVLSMLSTTSLEEVAAAGGPVWLQLYLYRDRSVGEGLLRRAEAARVKAVVLTVDAPRLGRRERDVRNRFRLPEGLAMRNLAAEDERRLPAAEGSALSAYADAFFKTDLSWDDVRRLRDATRLPVWLKGIVHPDDARIAVEQGVAGVIVSNHGGRQLDAAPATLDALPKVAEAVAGRVPIVLDGGVRRGSDVVKAIALGAVAVAVGRPVLWGLAVDGEAGATRVLRILAEETAHTLLLCGCRSPAEVTRDLIA